MAFALHDYERIVDRVEVDDVDFDAFRDEPLGEDVLRCLRYVHDVEHHTSCYLRNLLNTRAHDDPEISTFLTLWAFEEHWHGDAVARVLRAHGEPAGAERIAAMRARQRFQHLAPMGWMAMSAATRHFLAVHMTFGVINEWTTQGGYARLRQVARHPVLDALLARIMKQEGRHIDFYLSQATARLDESAGARRTTRALLRAVWSPVGPKAMPREETRHVARTLFGGPEGAAVVDRVDRRIDRLPGLAGLGLVARSQARLAA